MVDLDKSSWSLIHRIMYYNMLTRIVVTPIMMLIVFTNAAWYGTDMLRYSIKEIFVEIKNCWFGLPNRKELFELFHIIWIFWIKGWDGVDELLEPYKDQDQESYEQDMMSVSYKSDTQENEEK